MSLCADCAPNAACNCGGNAPPRCRAPFDNFISLRRAAGLSLIPETHIHTYILSQPKPRRDIRANPPAIEYINCMCYMCGTLAERARLRTRVAHFHKFVDFNYKMHNACALACAHTQNDSMSERARGAFTSAHLLPARAVEHRASFECNRYISNGVPSHTYVYSS